MGLLSLGFPAILTDKQHIIHALLIQYNPSMLCFSYSFLFFSTKNNTSNQDRRKSPSKRTTIEIMVLKKICLIRDDNLPISGAYPQKIPIMDRIKTHILSTGAGMGNYPKKLAGMGAGTLVPTPPTRTQTYMIYIYLCTLYYYIKIYVYHFKKYYTIKLLYISNKNFYL
jgi:hypothetical protein